MLLGFTGFLWPAAAVETRYSKSCSAPFDFGNVLLGFTGFLNQKQLDTEDVVILFIVKIKSFDAPHL